ncbi:hypothetical protein BFS16_03930 [Hoylesella timonensis]|uniref:Uncharacterized protein n=1 Tax=Hoylesella timonensis TaxID=386414 RepID=A0A2K0XLZ7_9BACT|nr:hypothetical protein BFS16_03930 [Hoylesella timonensis]
MESFPTSVSAPLIVKLLCAEAPDENRHVATDKIKNFNLHALFILLGFKVVFQCFGKLPHSRQK